jgi:hypothetical protein
MIEDITIIDNPACLRMAFSRLVQSDLVDVTEDRDVLRLDILEIGATTSTGADDRQIELIIEIASANDCRRADGSERHEAGGGALPDKAAPRGRFRI